MLKKNPDIIFIADDIESRVVFANAFGTIEREPSVGFFFDAASACDRIEKSSNCPESILLDAGKDLKKCLENIKDLRISLDGAACQIVVFDTHSILPNTLGIFSMGADNFLHKPYNFTRLKKVLPEFLPAKRIVAQITR